jgi:hypothetical protein
LQILQLAIHSTCTPAAACSDTLPIKLIYLRKKWKLKSLRHLGTKNCRESNHCIRNKIVFFALFYEVSSTTHLPGFQAYHLPHKQQLCPASGRSSSSGGAGGENWTSSEIAGEGGAKVSRQARLDGNFWKLSTRYDSMANGLTNGRQLDLSYHFDT